MSTLLLLMTLAGLYWFTLARHVISTNPGADSGDLIAAAAVGGVAHPTGYPTYLILVRQFLRLPIGGLALRAALLSGVSAVLAVLLVLALLRRFLPRAGVAPAPAAAWLAAAALGVSPLFWSLAVIPEVYALNALFWGLAAWACVRAVDRQRPPDWRDLSLALLMGIGLGNHLTLGLMLPLWLAASLRRVSDLRPGGRNAAWRALAGQLAALSAGLLITLAVPIRAAAHPAVNWGGALNWPNLWWVLSGQLYRGLLFGGLPVEMGSRVLTWGQALLDAYGPVGLAFVAAGAFRVRRIPQRSRTRALWTVAAWSFLIYSLFSLLYRARDAGTYLLPAIAGMAIWLGMGLQVVLSWAGQRAKWGEAAALAFAALAVGLPALRTYPVVDASRQVEAEVYAKTVMARAPRGAIIVSTADADSFPLWYTHFALGRRPDVRVVVGPLLGFEWYRAGLESTYPDLKVPTSDDPGWVQALLASNPRPVCRTWTDDKTGVPQVRCNGG